MWSIVLLLLIPLAQGQDPLGPSLLDGLISPPEQPPATDGIDQNALPAVGGLPFPALPPPPPLPAPNFNSPMSKRVMSSMTDLPAVIKSQMEGNPKPLRNMISHMLGEGLLSKLITSPLQAAEEMGMPLEDLGFNKSEALKKMKTDLEAQNITSFIDPEMIFGGGDSKVETTTSMPTPKTTPQMFIEGRPVANFDDFITRYNPKDESGKPLFKTEKKARAPTTPNPEQLAVEAAIARSKMQASGLISPHGQQYWSEDSQMADTFPIMNDPEQRPVSADIANTLDMGLIDPRRVSEVSNLLRRAPMRNPSFSPYSRSPVPIGIGNPDTLTPLDSSIPRSQSMAVLDPLNAPAVAFDSNIQNVVNTLKTKSVNSLSVGEVKELQAVLQNFEQTIKTKELLNKKRELQALQDQLEQQKKLMEEQKRHEVEMKMKEQHLMEARQEIETQLQQELHSFQSGFGLSGEVQRPSLPPTRPTPPPFDSSLLERALNQQMMMGPEREPEMTTTTRRPTTTRRIFTTRRTTTTTTTTEAPQPEEQVTESSGPSRGLLGGLSMGMSVVKRRPLPGHTEAIETPEEETEEPRVIPARVKENPFNLVRYSEDEAREDKVEEAPTVGGGTMRSAATKKRPATVTPSIARTITSLVTPSPLPKPELFEGPIEAPMESSVEATEYTGNCECIQVSQERMVGRWVPALASPSVITRIEEAMGVLLDEDSVAPTCAKIEFSVPRYQKNIGANSAKMTASFKTQTNSQLTKLRGNAVSADNRSIEIKLNDLHGNNISAPFCILKAEGRTVYDYLVVVNSQGPCNEAVLLVRDPDAFFDGDNSELIAYFKHMINRKELEPLEAVSFSNDCTGR